jgi:hypothetical protein
MRVPPVERTGSAAQPARESSVAQFCQNFGPDYLCLSYFQYMREKQKSPLPIMRQFSGVA